MPNRPGVSFSKQQKAINVALKEKKNERGSKKRRQIKKKKKAGAISAEFPTQQLPFKPFQYHCLLRCSGLSCKAGQKVHVQAALRGFSPSLDGAALSEPPGPLPRGLLVCTATSV